jgi:hypothetical protein
MPDRVVRINPGPGASALAFSDSTVPLHLESLLYQLGFPRGDNFTISRFLIDLVERAGREMNELDRQQLARLLTAAGHQLILSCRGDHP